MSDVEQENDVSGHFWVKENWPSLVLSIGTLCLVVSFIKQRRKRNNIQNIENNKCKEEEKYVKKTPTPSTSGRKDKVIGLAIMNLRICVFGSSSKRTRDVYKKASFELGKLISEAGHINVNGAGKSGCMGHCNKGSLSVAGSVIEGVIHKMWMPEGEEDELQRGLTTLHVAGGPTLAERKKMLCQLSDCFLVLPGGPGTLDELWEVVGELQLGLPKGKCPRPVCLVNVEGFWDPTIAQLQRAYNDGMLYKEWHEIIHTEPDAEKSLAWIVKEVHKYRNEHQKKSDGRDTARISDEGIEKNCTL